MPHVDEPLTTQHETTAFETLFHEHEAGLYRYLRSIAGSSISADDLYQETWLRVSRHLAQHKSIRNFKSFLYTTATNLFRDELRKLQVRRFFLGSLEDQSQQGNESIWVATDDENQNDLLGALELGLKRLSPRQRMAFSLVYLEDMKIDEVAGIMKCAPGTVKSTLFKAVKKLRYELKEFRE